MALPSTGSLSLNIVNLELKRSLVETISLNDAAVRKMAGKTSGAISFSDLRGKSWWFVDVQQYPLIVRQDNYVYTSYVVDFEHGWPDVYATSITVTDFTIHNPTTGAVTIGPHGWESNWGLIYNSDGFRSYLHGLTGVILQTIGFDLETAGTGKSKATFSIFNQTTRVFSCKINVTFSNGQTTVATVTKAVVDGYK